MQYVNKKTGKIIDVTSVLGGAWEPVKAPEKKAPVKKKKDGAKKK